MSEDYHTRKIQTEYEPRTSELARRAVRSQKAMTDEDRKEAIKK